MKRTDAPSKQPVPFGVNGQREPILQTTPSGDNTASYDVGFPPITMTLKSAGGLPPKGQDVNQILYELSALGRWFSAGVFNNFDSTFAASIGGYPAGAFVLGDDLKTIYRSTADNNTANPNSVTTGWAKVAQDVADILALGTAAYREVGTGTNQLPDMTSFASTATSQSLPGGKKFMWGNGVYQGSSGASGTVVTFPTAFPSACYIVLIIDVGSGVNRVAANPISRTQFNCWGKDASDTFNTTSFKYLAIGE